MTHHEQRQSYNLLVTNVKMWHLPESVIFSSYKGTYTYKHACGVFCFNFYCIVIISHILFLNTFHINFYELLYAFNASVTWDILYLLIIFLFYMIYFDEYLCEIFYKIYFTWWIQNNFCNSFIDEQAWVGVFLNF